MAHTTFRKSVPYNTIRLGGDVAQFSIYEVTNDGRSYSSWIGLGGMADISMADLQRASGTNIDPNDGRVTTGPLSPMRYGISVLGDVSSTDGVYSYQVGGTNSDFVGTRSYNLSSNPANIRLSRLAAWDYTAVVTPTDLTKMDFKSGGSSIWLQTSRYGCELFKDQPMWVAGAKSISSNTTRTPVLFRSNIYGDKFSNYIANNYVTGTHNSDMNDILSVVPLKSNYGTTLGSAVASYATIGRRTSSTGNAKVQAYTVTINSNASFSTATTGTAFNMTTGASSNYANSGACYIDDGLFAVVGGRGNSGFYLNRVTWNGSTFSSSNTTLDPSTGFGATRGDVVSLLNNYGATNKYCAAVWCETKGTNYNRYCRIQMFNMNSSISTVGSEGTVFDISNSILSTRATLLSTDADAAYVLVAISDSSFNVRLKVMEYDISAGTWSAKATLTYTYGDSNLNDLFSVTTLSAVEKTAVTTDGSENFIPGQGNNFKQRVYWALSVSTNSEQDNVNIQYGYYDITNNSLVFLNSGTAWQGRNVALMKNHYGTDARSWAENIPVRNEAGPVFMPIMGGRYVSSSSKYLTTSCIALDYKPSWNSTGGDPGSNFFDTVGNQYTDQTNAEPGDAGDWKVVSRWKVGFPMNKGTASWLPSPATAGVSNQYLISSTLGVSFAAVGSTLVYLTLNDRDADSNDWGNFFDNELIPYQTGNDVYLRLGTDSGALLATFEIAAGAQKVLGRPPVGGNSPYLSINWANISNVHSGASWAFLNNSEGDPAYITAEFSKTAF